MPLPSTVPVETKQWNALHSAALKGNEAMIEILLSSGLNIDSRSDDGLTPLMVAATSGKKEAVNLLLIKGADPHLKNYMGISMLHAAAEGGNTSIVEKMLSYGIDIDSRDDQWDSVTPLIIAAIKNHAEVIEKLLERDAKGSLTTGSTERNVLYMASRYGSVAAIKKLLSCLSPELRDSRDDERNTPLALAIAFEHVEAVNCLLEHGADPLLKGKDGWNLLHFATYSGNVTIIDTMLSKGLDINSRDETMGLTPFLVSLKFGKLEAANHLREKGTNESLETNTGNNALLLAAFSGSVAAIEMLLSRGFRIDTKNAAEKTPLLVAARNGNTEAVDYLLAHGANPFPQNKEGYGLLHLAAFSNNVATIEAVLSIKFDINALGTSIGLTPLLACLASGKLEAAIYLLERGADEHLETTVRTTVLSSAAMGGNVEAIKMLLERGHNPNHTDDFHRTPLERAVIAGNIAAVEFLAPLTH